MQGILLVDKPKGWTSFDVVNRVRRIVATELGKKPKNVKVGHTGTLDPLATGLLVLLIGKEHTRRAGELSKVDKTYEVTMRLGQTSTTADEEGEKTIVSDYQPTEEEVRNALTQFTGRIMQMPPMYSAMKINGKRAYELARAGKEVKLEARPVMIYESMLVGYEYPFVRFDCSVSSGTYVRSLVEDLGVALQTGAYMSDLRRTHVGEFSIDESIGIEGMTAEILAASVRQLPQDIS